MDFPIELIKMASRGGGGTTDAVKYTEQTLTEEQQMQARKNQGLYYEKNESIVIEWDGDTTGREHFELMPGFPASYRVDPRVLSASDFVGGEVTSSNGSTYVIRQSDIVYEADGLTITGDATIISAVAGTHSLFGGELIVPADGTYVTVASSTEDSTYMTRFEKTLETISKIDPKFLHESIVTSNEQTLTEEQKTQARKNLGLYWSESSDVVIEWDGDTTGRATIDIAGTPYYKVSDIFLSTQDLTGATLTTSDGESSEISPEHIQEPIDGFVVGDSFLVSARAGVYDVGISITVPEDGVYFAIDEGQYATRLEFVRETISGIDQKFIPKSIARTDDVVKHYVFSDQVMYDEFVAAVTEVESGRAMIIWGTSHIATASVLSSSSVHIRFEEDPYVLKEYTKNNYGFISLNSPDASLYQPVFTNGVNIMREGAHNYIGFISAGAIGNDVVEMNGKFLFDRDGVIITASDNPQKRFRITVNSSGTISATEITSNS